MINPILSFSATRRMRSFRTLLIMGAYLAVLLGIVAALMPALFRNQILLGSLSSGITCYAVLIGAQFALLVLIAPALSSAAIAGERERQTLELLLVTQTGSLRIVLGKAMESFAVLALLVVTGLPVTCLCLLTGAVTLSQVLAGEGFLLAVAFGGTAVGVFSSALCRRTVSATVVSYLMILVIAVLTALPFLTGYPRWITDVIYDEKRYWSMPAGEALAMISPLLLANPGYGLLSLLCGQTRLGASSMDYRGWGRILCTWRVMDRAGGETVGLLSAGMIILAGILLLLLAALLVRPGDRKMKQ